MQDLLRDADLLQILLAGVGVVAVDDAGGVLDALFRVQLVQLLQVFIVVVGAAVALFVHIAAHDGVGVRVARGLDLPAAVEERVVAHRRIDGVHHHAQVAARGVLHADGHINTARDEAVLLILDRARADSDIAQNVGEIAVVFGIEHLVGAGKAGLLHRAGVEAADGDDALEHVGLFARVGLVEHALVARAVGARLVRVDARDDQDLILDLFLQGDEAADIVHHAVLAVGRAGADDEHQAAVTPVEDRAHLFHARLTHLGDLFRDGELFFNVHRDGQFTDEFCILLHNEYSLSIIDRYCLLFYSVPRGSASAISWRTV